MPKRRADRVREQVVVYLDAKDRQLLEDMVEATGLARTELFRRGLRRLANEALEEAAPGSSLDYLADSAATDDHPPDVSDRADAYLYGGRYRSGRARPD